MLKGDISTRSMRESFEREVKTISSFDHENILHLIGVVIVGKRLYNIDLQNRFENDCFITFNLLTFAVFRKIFFFTFDTC